MTRRESLQSIALVAASLFGVVALGEGVGEAEKALPNPECDPVPIIQHPSPMSACTCPACCPLKYGQGKLIAGLDWGNGKSEIIYFPTYPPPASWGTLAQEGIS